ncbi:enoyl-CoA hydratase/isomerase family protein [Cryptosporangium aurantiacum]|uniref:Enoyl-CoA hydratase/carnithine racemase n=1 Tax=Cryptosporangium aurantiacum TaxID=134849 RepID=A0A1M7RM16_9ACTN|nr:enoyl-CoA hydratase/isomerase family protein [Cryptosporangium aurantiacum]SHN47142.1 Enoyl-CoA hydratase/carnithine racemase [Cryptosporangium aurantiacum]
MNLDVPTLLDALGDPKAAESFSAVLGVPLVAVEVPDAASAAGLAALLGPGRWAADVRALPCVVALVVPDPAVFTGAGHVPLMLGDVLLTDDPDAPRPYVAPAGGSTAGVDALAVIATANPVAATALALLLRSAEGLDVPAGLVAESATYSTLQAGEEFVRWRAGRPVKPADPSTGRVRVERDGHALRVTMTRPQRRNALDAAMRDALAEAFTLAIADPDATLEFRGEGPEFCAGGDLDEFGSRPDPALAHLTRLTRSPARLLHTVAGRATAHLHGACLGAGIELPAFAGRVIAAPDTSIGLPEVSLGLVPGAGGTVSMPRRIGRQRTAWIGLSGQRVNADTALRWGLVDAIGPAGETS